MGQSLRDQRQARRWPVVMPAKCRSRSGFVDHVIIADISEHGCRIESGALHFSAGQLVVIRPQGLEGLCGQIRWVAGHTAGIAFERPLYLPVVEHLRRCHAQFFQPSMHRQHALRRAA